MRLDLLIVEDEFLSAEFISEEVTKLGHNVIACVDNAEDAFKTIVNENIDLVLMDINIFGATDGIQCAKHINTIKEVPIIYLTAYGDQQTIEEASETNIYGFLIKPFDKEDLIATLSVATKRVKENIKNLQKENELSHLIKLSDSCQYDLHTKTLFDKGTPIIFTKKESEILHLLIKNQNQTTPYETIMENIWGEKEVTTSAIRDTILRIRKKAPLLQIDTVSGVGYTLKREL